MNPMGMSPYKMVYSKACHLPLELEHKAYWAIKQLNFDFKLAGEKRLFDISSLDEWRAQAYENANLFKEKVKRWHDKRIQKREFNVGDYVLLYNSHLRFFACKLLSKWEGPYVVEEVYRSVAIKINNTEGNFPRVVNGQRIKHYFSGTPINVETNIINIITPEEYIRDVYQPVSDPENEEVCVSVSNWTPNFSNRKFSLFWNLWKIRKIKSSPESARGGHKLGCRGLPPWPRQQGLWAPRVPPGLRFLAEHSFWSRKKSLYICTRVLISVSRNFPLFSFRSCLCCRSRSS
ncbi:reverse transcriptase [Hordeum vulgare]|nr:reverse transcriptase [Hordeum vulgare]